MIGHTVSITKTDGSIIEGIFHTYCPFEKVEGKNVYVVKGVKLIKSPSTSTNNNISGETFQEGSTLLLSSEQVLKVHIKSIRLDNPANNNNNNSNDIRTDAEISGQKGGTEKLVAAGSVWTAAGDGGGDSLESSSNNNNNRGGMFKSSRSTNTTTTQTLSGTIGDWDQFHANESKFNIKSSYDENLYTTSLDYKNLDKRKLAEAERIAKEIEGTVSSNIHLMEERGHKIEGDYDEEDLYSGVLKKLDGVKVTVVENKDGAATPAADGVEKKKENGMNYAAATAAGGNKDNVDAVKKDEMTQSTEKKKEDEEETKKDPSSENGDTKEGETKIKLNPNAKEFTFNPSAKSFTPSFGASSSPAVALPPTNAVEYPQGGGGMHHPGMMGSYHPGTMQFMQPGVVPGGKSIYIFMLTILYYIYFTMTN